MAQSSAVDTIGQDAIQRHMDKPVQWAQESLRKFNKCKVLHLGKAIPEKSTGWEMISLGAVLPRRTYRFWRMKRWT